MTLDRSFSEYQQDVAAIQEEKRKKRVNPAGGKKKPHQLDLDLEKTAGLKLASKESTPGNHDDITDDQGLSVADPSGTVRILKAKLQVVTQQLEQVLIRAKNSVRLILAS